MTDELYGANKQRVMNKTKAIYDSLLQIFEASESESISTLEASNRFCEKKIETRKAGSSFFTMYTRPKWKFRH
ncbi:phenylalanine dehydrogenase [Bacillus freudenreichii]|nr:phenylalanine dehydrogenase [Bacillus freudenreichii]